MAAIYLDTCMVIGQIDFAIWQGESLQRPEQLPLAERLPFNEFSENT